MFAAIDSKATVAAMRDSLDHPQRGARGLVRLVARLAARVRGARPSPAAAGRALGVCRWCGPSGFGRCHFGFWRDSGKPDQRTGTCG